MYHTIIVPTDGSARSERAIPVAVGLAAASGAALQLVRVYTHDRRDLDDDPTWEESFRETVDDALARLARTTSDTLGRTVGYNLLDVPVVPALCDYIASHDQPLVVMTSHGRTGVGRALLGSVSDELVRRGPAPVLVLRDNAAAHGTPTWARTERPCRVILVPLDGSPLAELAVPHAVNMARMTGARIHLLRVVAPVMAGSPFGPAFAAFPMPPTEIAETRTELAREYLASIERSVVIDGAPLNISTEVALGDRAARAIVASCRNEGADLVVMATHARGPSRLLVRAVSDSVVRGGVEAILLVRPTPASPPARAQTIAEQQATSPSVFDVPALAV